MAYSCMRVFRKLGHDAYSYYSSCNCKMYGSTREERLSQMNPRKQNNGSDKKCQKVIHHIKWLKNKRAILVLVWSFCVFTCYNHFQSLLMGNSLKFVPLSIMIAFGLALFSLLVDGLLMSTLEGTKSFMLTY